VVHGSARSRASIQQAYERVFAGHGSTPLSDLIDGGAPLSDAQLQQLAATNKAFIGKLTLRVDNFEFVDSTHAALAFDLLVDGQPVTAETLGQAVLESGRWKVARATFCEIVQRGGTTCSP
jgi:hypothetical protein